MAVGSVHSCHTALSNYSTIAATQVMEFQLKYDSFRICICPKRLVGVVFHGLGGEGVDSREGLVQEAYFPVYTLHLSNPPSSIKRE